MPQPHFESAGPGTNPAGFGVQKVDVPGFHTGSGGSAVENFAVSTTLRILKAVKSAISSPSMPATLEQST